MSEENQKAFDSNFTEEQMYEDELIANPTDAVVDDIMWKLKAVTNEIKDIKARKQDSISFYDAKIEKKMESINRMEGVIENYVRSSERKTVEVPNGIMRVRTIKKIAWDRATDEELISFSLENNIDVKNTIKPVRKAIKDYIKSTGDAPDWFEETEEGYFSYKLSE